MRYKQTISGQKPSLPLMISRITAAVALSAVISGCGQDMSDLKEYVETTKNKKYGEIKPIPKIKDYAAYAYPGHERNPFDSSIITAKPKNIAADASIEIDTDRTPEYLESFPLDSLSFVGTLFQQETLWALVQGPDGTIQRVRTGNYMGQNYGQIMSISDIEIQLSEIIPDGYGGYKKNQNSVALKGLEE
jgi:type IV pilus assembly protein PilP